MIEYTSQPKDNNISINKHSLQAIFGIPGVVFYDSKCTRTSHFLQKLLIEVSSRKGEYISDLFSIKQSSSTCLRIVKSIEMPHYQELTTIGIDDWADRKGKSYGTIIVNALNHRL